MYLPMAIVRRQNGEAAELPGVWLGMNERTLVGAEKGHGQMQNCQFGW